MRRRKFIRLLGAAATAWPLGFRAQQPDLQRHIGVLMAFAESDQEGQARIGAFREELHKAGWTEGRNIRIDYGWAGGDAESRQQIAQQLVAQHPDLLLRRTPPQPRRRCSRREPFPSFSQTRTMSRLAGWF